MYPFSEIEPKWQKYWEEHKTFTISEDPSIPKEKRRYVLDMFPYPSAEGLHVGHPEGYTATDIYCRYLRMNGYSVLHPMGFDSFGLPAETYAIKTNTNPRITTEKNIDCFRRQIKRLGFSYDWSREIQTHTPQYYKWTQWIFSQLYKKGLAYEQEMLMWYCPTLGTVLANEEIIPTNEGPRSERGLHPVERRPLRQWMLKITEYADRLLKDLDELDWPESIKSMQRNWIGRSEGAVVYFPIANTEDSLLHVFTTRPDTLWGATYMVISPEHPMLPQLTTSDNTSFVEDYIKKTSLKSDLERTDLLKEKTGVFTGSYAINPVNKKEIPIFIADYVLMGYGTGAIMAVPAHDERDWDFAKKFNLPITYVVCPKNEKEATLLLEEKSHPYTSTTDSVLINSGVFNSFDVLEAKEKIISSLESQHYGKKKIQYKLRDWIFSRQRYWGEPIPIVHTENKEKILMPEHILPITLPEVENYAPSGTGESPLVALTDWLTVTLPDGKIVQRETNTMPQWAGSCWYYLRYLDPHNEKEFVSKEKVEYWMPVDLYLGGAEHAVLHLLYARFWHKVLFDLGLVNTKEPFQKLINQGMILGEDGNKMSKSLGNVINPDEIIDTYGADSLRIYEMFMGPLKQEKPWSTNGLVGINRFLTRVWNIAHSTIKAGTDDEIPMPLKRILHKTIKKVGEDTQTLSYNTAIAQMMILLNEIQKYKCWHREALDIFLRLLSPYAPHISEELWQKLHNDDTLVCDAQWPTYDEALIIDKTIEVVFQINGKVRSKMTIERDISQETLKEYAMKDASIQKYIADKHIKKTIVVPNKLVNIVI